MLQWKSYSCADLDRAGVIIIVSSIGGYHPLSVRSQALMDVWFSFSVFLSSMYVSPVIRKSEVNTAHFLTHHCFYGIQIWTVYIWHLEQSKCSTRFWASVVLSVHMTIISYFSNLMSNVPFSFLKPFEFAALWGNAIYKYFIIITTTTPKTFCNKTKNMQFLVHVHLVHSFCSCPGFMD